MKKNDQTYLQDILHAIEKIEEYVKEISYDDFIRDDMRQDAVIRQLEIIGEAANKLSDDFRNAHPDFPIKEAVRMRNFLIHGYDEVDIDIVWKTIQQDIPSIQKVLNGPAPVDRQI